MGFNLSDGAASGCLTVAGKSGAADTRAFYVSSTTSGIYISGTTAACLTASAGMTALGFDGSPFAEPVSEPKIKDLNLEDTKPPSENTRIHRKRVRVTDLARPSIYILYHQDEVVYVGQSINPYQRMAQHMRDKRFTDIRIMSCKRTRMSYWEQKLIQAYNPRYNVTHNKKKRRHFVAV